MTLPTVVALAFMVGALAALAGRAEIKLSPRHPLLTRSFAAFVIFSICVLVPISVYFYVFHGDWFLLYLIDVREIPSAIALVAFVLEVLVGVLGFALGATLLRTQREGLVGAAAAIALALAVLIPVLLRDRLSHVGSYAQWNGGFGLVDFTAGPIFLGTILMSVAFLAASGFLVGRLWVGERR
ncbi:MAG: hypothetical protein J0L92_17875 [Deltaproteobacteria bacterium]|nr:hypothetical protein [Deltaproteobacteria bacterium]